MNQGLKCRGIRIICLDNKTGGLTAWFTIEHNGCYEKTISGGVANKGEDDWKIFRE